MDKETEALSKEICLGCKTRHECKNKDGFCIMSDVVAEWLFEKGYGNVKEYQNEIDRLKKLITDFDKFGDMTTPIGLLPINTEGMRKLVDAYSELRDQVCKEIAREVSNEIKDIMFAHLKHILHHNESGLHPKDTEDCIGLVKTVCYAINRTVLNEKYGFNEPLDACNQFLVEKELVSKYHIEVDK